MKWVRSADALACLTLFFSSFFFFYDLLYGRYLLTERDLGPYFIPPRFFWVQSIKNLDLPLWNPYQFSGSPFLANPQHGVLYPLNGLFFFLPFDVAFNVIILLHFFLGGLFVYLLLKDLDVEPSGALLSGLVFMLSGFLLSVHSLLSVLLSVIWTPLVLLFFRRAISRRGFKNEALCALMMTLSFLGGGIEIVYGNFLVLLLMVIFYPFSNNSFGWGGLRVQLNRFKSLFIVSLLFLLLSAIQLIPFLELYSHSIRGNGISYQEATIWSFAPKDIFLFFLPDAFGYFLDMKKYWATQCWFKTLYTGGLPFILSLIFFLFPHPPLSPYGERNGVRVSHYGERNEVGGFGKNRRLFLVLMFFSIFLALGSHNPLYPFIFKYFPFFNGIRYPAKFLYLFFFVLSITAGLGFQRLVELSEALRRKSLKNLPILLSLLSGLILLFLVIGQQENLPFLKGERD